MADDSTEVETLENPNPSSDERSAPPPPSVAMASVSLGIWPPSQRTREAVTQRLVEMLSSSSSALAKRYGSLSADEALAAARSIEAAAFASSSAAADGDGHVSSSIDGGLEILEKYSKEISTKMLEAAKARSPNPSTKPDPSPESHAEPEKAEEAGSEASTAD